MKKKKEEGRKKYVWNGKIIHLIVHDYACCGDDELGAEEEVDGAGDADSHA